MEVSSTPKKIDSTRPLGEIALMLSGGGYRAAAFHLGMLSMLQDLDLLKDVTRLSTISGGTIIGAKYALAVATDPAFDFAKFEKDAKAVLGHTNVIAQALRKLHRTTRPNSIALTPSLIRSAASIYADTSFVGNTTLGTLRTAKTGIKEVSFTSTDFFTGTRFRFQFSHLRSQVATGSTSLRVGEPVADKIRLADIIAASSCFPGGFEPIFFPSDFTWPESIKKIKKSLGPKYVKDVPLMDGGIIDNQGIDNIRDFLDRNDGETNFCIISDSSPRRSILYDAEPKEESFLKIPLWLVLLLFVFSFAASLVTIFVLGIEGINLWMLGQLGWCRAISNYMLPIVLSIVVVTALSGVAGLFLHYRKDAEKQIRGFGGWLCFLRLSLPSAFQFAKSRVSSVMAMTKDVFMGRIRSLSYTSVFSNKELRPFSMANLIYDLDESSLWRQKVPPKYFPTRKLRKMVRSAEKYDTTLNFDGCPETLDLIVEAGRATTCFNILRYLVYTRKVDGQDQNHPLTPLFKTVESAWMAILCKH